jgi:anthranilate synthase/aminodeoxychorismate synthase-like glutamine amidotransferase
LILILDNFDSFTYNLVDYLSQLGVEYKIFRNDEDFEKIISYSYKGIVLSPGPGTPHSAGCMNKLIKYYYEKLPILGICLGHQALGEHFGSKLEKALLPMHGKISKIKCEDSIIFKDLGKNLNVVRYHSLILKNISPDFRVIAETSTGEVMAIEHQYLPIIGLQFHPEAALTDSGISMLRNWIKYNNLFD